MSQQGAKGTHGQAIEWDHPRCLNRKVEKSPLSNISTNRFETDDYVYTAQFRTHWLVEN